MIVCNMVMMKGKHGRYYMEESMQSIAKRMLTMAKHMQFIKQNICDLKGLLIMS